MAAGDAYEPTHEGSDTWLNCQYGSTRIGRAIVGKHRIGNIMSWCLEEEDLIHSDDLDCKLIRILREDSTQSLHVIHSVLRYLQDSIASTDGDLRNTVYERTVSVSHSPVIARDSIRMVEESLIPSDDIDIVLLRYLVESFSATDVDPKDVIRITSATLVTFADFISSYNLSALTQVLTPNDEVKADELRLRLDSIDSSDDWLKSLYRIIGELINTSDEDHRPFLRILEESVNHIDIHLRDLERMRVDSIASTDSYWNALIHLLNESINFTDLLLRNSVRIRSDDFFESDNLLRDLLRLLLDELESVDGHARRELRIRIDEATSGDVIKKDGLRLIKEALLSSDTSLHELLRKVGDSFSQVNEDWARILHRIIPLVFLPTDEDHRVEVRERTESTSLQVAHVNDLIRYMWEDVYPQDDLDIKQLKILTEVLTQVNDQFDLDLIRLTLEYSVYESVVAKDGLRLRQEDFDTSDILLRFIDRLNLEAMQWSDEHLRELIRITAALVYYEDDVRRPNVLSIRSEDLLHSDGLHRAVLRLRQQLQSLIDDSPKDEVRVAASELIQSIDSHAWTKFEFDDDAAACAIKVLEQMPQMWTPNDLHGGVINDVLTRIKIARGTTQ